MEDDDDIPPFEDGTEENEEIQPNAASPAAVKRRQSKQKLQIRDENNFWKSVFADPIGRRAMWNLLQETKINETVFACGPNGFPQPEATWFNLGKQELGHRLLRSWTLIDRDGVFAMQDENDPAFSGKSKK